MSLTKLMLVLILVVCDLWFSNEATAQAIPAQQISAGQMSQYGGVLLDFQTNNLGDIMTIGTNSNHENVILYISCGYCAGYDHSNLLFDVYLDNQFIATYSGRTGESFGGLRDQPSQAAFILKQDAGGSPGVWRVQNLRYAPNFGQPQPQFGVTGTLQACKHSTPMYVAEHAGYGDFFYTVDSAQHQLALGYGYQSQTPTYSVEAIQNQSNKALRRFFIGMPQIEHFYTISDAEANFVVNFGYSAEGNEGFIYSVQKPNTAPLVRWANFNPSTSDLKHFYAVHGETPSGANWVNEGVIGYACN